MADKTYKLTFELSDGNKKEVQFTVPQGPKGDTGDQGIQGVKGDKGDSGVYVLSESEDLTQVPDDVNVIVDPYANSSAVFGGQSDWNAHEYESGHILNRTHYVELKKVTVLNEAQLSFQEDIGAYRLDKKMPLVDGEVYTVSWNGVEYRSTSHTVKVESTSTQVLGNIGALIEGYDDTGEPYLILNGVEYGGIIPLDGTTELTITVSGPIEVVHTIPEKFISGFAKVCCLDVNVSSMAGDEYLGYPCYVVDRNYDEIAQDLYEGAVMNVRLYNADGSLAAQQSVFQWEISTGTDNGLILTLMTVASSGITPWYIRLPNGNWTPPAK